MGFLKILRKIKRTEREMRILVLGLDNSGKSTIVCRLRGKRTDQVSPTLGFEIHTLAKDGFKLSLWDIGGQTTIRAYWRNYFEKTDGLIWVIDSSDKSRILECKRQLQQVLKEERLTGITILIFANKQDLNGCLNTDEISKLLNLSTFESSHSCKLLACSALDNSSKDIHTGLQWLVDDIGSRIYSLD